MIFHQGLSESPRNIPLRSISISTPASGDSLRGNGNQNIKRGKWNITLMMSYINEYYIDHQFIYHYYFIISLFIIPYDIFILHTSMMIVLIAFWLVSNYNKCWIYGYTVPPVEWVFKHSTYSWRCPLKSLEPKESLGIPYPHTTYKVYASLWEAYDGTGDRYLLTLNAKWTWTSENLLQ